MYKVETKSRVTYTHPSNPMVRDPPLSCPPGGPRLNALYGVLRKELSVSPLHLSAGS